MLQWVDFFHRKIGVQFFHHSYVFFVFIIDHVAKIESSNFYLAIKISM